MCFAGAGPAPQAALGVLRLHPESVQRALTDQALGLLLPPTLIISFQQSSPTVSTSQPELSQRASMQELAVSPQNSETSSQVQQRLQVSSASSQLSDQKATQRIDQQPSQQAWVEPGQDQSGNSPEWRQLSGGPEGSGFGGNRGNIWAMVASVGCLVPLSMQVQACC